MLHSNVSCSPSDILRFASIEGLVLEIDSLRDVLPSRSDIGILLEALSSDPIHSSLAVMDPLLPWSSDFEDVATSPSDYDNNGYSKYARVVSALLQELSEDRQVAKRNMWALRHFLALSLYADDYLRVPTASSPAFDARASPQYLRDIITKVNQVSTYLLSSSVDDGIHSRVIAAAASTELPATLAEGVEGFLVDLLLRSKGTDNAREPRILRRVLQHIFSNVSKNDADQWIGLARKLEKSGWYFPPLIGYDTHCAIYILISLASRTSLAIVASVTQFAPEPPRLDRYRNELAANLFGVPASKANTEGLLSLRKLAAAAPDPESEVIFLPQIRAVNVMKTCQQWIASDEEIDEEVESEMTLIFYHLVPLLQNVPGAHWDLTFDVIENNLEVSPPNIRGIGKCS